MKVYRLDFTSGEYYTLTAKELKEQFTSDQIEEFYNNGETLFYETPYTPRQLTRARKLHSDPDYCYNFEQENGIAPSVFDILKSL